MKQQDIKIGYVYTDGKAGLRRVTAAGPEYKLYDGQEETDCLQYEIVASAVAGSIVERGRSAAGKPLANSTRQSFAAWAKAAVPVDQLEQKIAEIGAKRVKLTPPQAKLMRTFEPADDLNTGRSWCCEPDELRTARACQDKGLLTLEDEPCPRKRFEVRLTRLGIEVARLVITNAQAPE
ncbi:hypothetical protein [Paraburkholderia humisilvae]|uniref:Uncharacterized protein n=1 Tax=Paraburkholderia humisilvae TaxID=627669 RepID=A0A6J5DLY1_9BURK|nr:hypothetical protein [Paraburkholderia humisilvae]CAB3754241.1 hypothetical protein LMG29542_02288 [Paraburkholderia humisilvae]